MIMEKFPRGRFASANPKFYSVAEVAEILRMSSMTVYRAIADGEVPAVRIRGRWIVPARAVDELIEAAMAEPHAMEDARALGGLPTDGGR